MTKRTKRPCMRLSSAPQAVKLTHQAIVLVCFTSAPPFDQRNSVAASRGSQALRVKHPRDRTWLSIAVGGSRIFRAYGMLL